MGNQGSNEHERNKSADDVLARRRRNDDHSGSSKPSNNNTSFILEKTFDRLKSPKTENKRRVSSPGLDILATDIKRGLLAKRVSTRDYRNINSTLRFVEAFATIKHQSANVINLNEAPNLGFNLESIRENFPPNQAALFDNRMSFSTDFNDPSQKFKFKMENYYASRDKIVKTHSEKYVKTRKQKPRPISLQEEIMVKPKNFSFDLSPSNSTPQSHNASFANAAAEVRTPRPFRDLVDEVLGKNKKAASATKGTHGEILGELKNIKGALSRIKKREQATSFQVPKTSSETAPSKSPIRSANSCKKAHCHSKSEVTPKKVSPVPLPNELFRIDEEKTPGSATERKPVTKVNKVESKSKTPVKSKQFSPEKTKKALTEKSENLVIDLQPKKEKHPLFGDLSVKKKPSVSGTSSLNNTEPRKTARSRIEEIKTKEEPKYETARKPRPSQIYNKENKPINATPSQRYSKVSSENDGTSYTALSNKKKTQPLQIKSTKSENLSGAPTKRFDLVSYKQQHELKSQQTSEDATNTSSQLHRDIALKKAYQPLYLNDMSEHLSQPLDTIEVCPVAEPYEEGPAPIEAVLDLSQYIAATPQNKENIGIFKVSQKIDEIYKVQRLNDRLKEADMNNIPKSESRYRADHSDEEQDFTEEDIEENVFVDEIKDKLSKISVGQYHGTAPPTMKPDTVDNSTESQPQQIKKYESSFPEYMKNLFHDADSNMNDSFRKNLQKIGSALEKTKKLIAQKFNQQDSQSISQDKDHTLKSYEESGEENFTEDPNMRESKDERMSFIKVFPSHIAETHFASFNE